MTTTAIKPSEAVGYTRELLDNARWKLVEEITKLTVLQLALLARENWPEAKWIGLATTDQDMEGGQLVVCIKSADRQTLSDTGDDLQDVYTYNLDDDTTEFWNVWVDLQYGLNFPDDRDAERYLNIDKILEKLG